MEQWYRKFSSGKSDVGLPKFIVVPLPMWSRFYNVVRFPYTSAVDVVCYRSPAYRITFVNRQILR